MQGSAVAVASDQLLAACDAAKGKELVSVARRSSVHLAQVRGAGAEGRLCVLSVPDAEVDTVRGYRPFADLQVGEPLVDADFTGHLHEEHVPTVRAWLDRNPG